MKQSQASIKRTIKKLREIIDSTEDAETRRMAYFAETTLRWAIEDTVSWKRPEEDLQDEVFLLKREAAQQSVQATAATPRKIGTKSKSKVARKSRRA